MTKRYEKKLRYWFFKQRLKRMFRESKVTRPLFRLAVYVLNGMCKYLRKKWLGWIDYHIIPEDQWQVVMVEMESLRRLRTLREAKDNLNRGA